VKRPKAVNLHPFRRIKRKREKEKIRMKTNEFEFIKRNKGHERELLKEGIGSGVNGGRTDGLFALPSPPLVLVDEEVNLLVLHEISEEGGISLDRVVKHRAVEYCVKQRRHIHNADCLPFQSQD